jgi:hypothetical protein
VLKRSAEDSTRVPDGLGGDADGIITSLAQFDVLSNIAAIDDADDADGRVFYTNFARFRQERIQPIVDRLLEDQDMRRAILRRDDSNLAIALQKIAEMAHSEGKRYDGFRSWE